MKKLFLFIILISFIFTSCKDDYERELENLQVYLDENNIDADPTGSGLYYIEILEGTGANASTGDLVRVHYEGRFLDGEIFDSSYERGEPLEFTLGYGYVISGWDEGISYMKEGGEATLIIPSRLAYGSKGSGSIPPYTTLIFDVDLISILIN